MTEHGTGKVIAFRLTPGKAQELIRVAANGSRFITSSHAKAQMRRREFDSLDLLRILRNGFVNDDPIKTKYGEWKCKVVFRLKGNRDAGVVTIILIDGSLFIKTVEWEDLH